MGIIALALVAGAKAGIFANLPDWLSFLRLHAPDPQHLEIPIWVKVICALTMAAGTAAGGWRIIRTLGHKMVNLHPINGFASDTLSATVVAIASHYGIPVSTTHHVSAAIMGLSQKKRGFSFEKPLTLLCRMLYCFTR